MQILSFFTDEQPAESRVRSQPEGFPLRCLIVNYVIVTDV